MASRQFDGKVAIVTGAASGMGRAIALKLAQHGAKVAVVDRVEGPMPNNFEGDQTTPTAELINKSGGQAIFIQLDLSNLDAVFEMVPRTVEALGRVDFLIQAAGINTMGSTILDQTPKMWEDVFAINARALFFGMQSALKQMLKQDAAPGSSRGKIVNIASGAGLFGTPLLSIYTSSKHAVLGFNKTAAIEMAKHNIQINTICPGLLMTNMSIEFMKAAPSNKTDELGGLLPRAGHPNDVASAAVYLCSSDADWITGTNLKVDGGLGANHS